MAARNETRIQMITHDREQELETNFAEFEKLLPTFQAQDNGKYVLMRYGKTVNIFDSNKDALIFAQAQFSDGMYSIQQITNKVMDLGYFSYAMPDSAV
jgi:hypothetical protein